MKLKSFSPGAQGVIVGYEKTDKRYRQKLIQLGIIKGVEFKMLRKAPLGDPLEIEIRGSKISLRKLEADILIVEELGRGEVK